MSALGKIRSKGVFLVTVIGLALFGFIAEEAVRSCQSSRNNDSQIVGEVLGNKVSYEEFNKMVDEYTEALKISQNRDNFSEEEMNAIRDEVWNNYVGNALIEQEAEKLGLRVTDDELRNLILEGKSQLLMQNPFFMNRQTGQFDAKALKDFINEFKKMDAQANGAQYDQANTVYKFEVFMEKMIRQQLLRQKYQTLLAACISSNKVEAKQAFNETNNESDILLATFPYSSVQDKDVQVSDEEMKAKYDELKELNPFYGQNVPFIKQSIETRDIKFVSLKVSASTTDRAEINKQVKAYADQLANGDDASEVVRKAQSQVPFLGIPVLKTAYPADIQAMLDSTAVGSVTAVKENAADNTLNVLKLISKEEMPDSIQYQVIQVGDQNIDAARKRADSIMTALSANSAQWDTIAKKMGSNPTAQWITSQMYQGASSMSIDDKNFISTLNTLSVGEVKNLALTSGNIIVKVSDRKATKTKYVAAVLKVKMNFSNDTYNDQYNKFSQFVAESTTVEDLEKNAKKYGYTVEEQLNAQSTQHVINNVRGSHEALKWAFNASAGEISPLYECGENDNLLVVALTNVHEKGYRSLDDKQVNEYIKARCMNEKKAEKLIEKAKALKSINDATAQGATVDTLKHVTFAEMTMTSQGAPEPSLSGAVSVTEKGKMSAHPVKGNAGVYVFQVVEKTNRGMKEDSKAIQQSLAQKAQSNLNYYMTDLLLKAKIKDNRVNFF